MGLPWHDQAKVEWDQKSADWHARSKQMWEEGSRKEILPLMRKYLSSPPRRILDAGCGDGYASWRLAEAGYEVIGMDLSEAMIARACSGLEQVDLKLNFLVGDLTKLPFANHSFDGLISINALEWLEDPIDGVLELKRVLKPGGILCLGILGPTAGPRMNSYARLKKELVICNTMMPWEAQQLFQENGFQLLDGKGAYKQGVTPAHLKGLSDELRQALSFLWVFIFRHNLGS